MKLAIYILLAILCLNSKIGIVYNDIDTANQKVMPYYEWNSIDGKYSKVYYNNDEQEAKMVLRAADLYFPMITADFKNAIGKKPVLVVYEHKSEMADALALNKFEPVPMGAYSNGHIFILTPSAWISGSDSDIIDIFLEKGPVTHELVHFAMDDGNMQRFHTWFTEGVALYYEKKYTGFEWRPDLKKESAEINDIMIVKHFDNLPIDLAYRKSYDIIANYVNSYGEKALEDYINNH